VAEPLTSNFEKYQTGNPVMLRIIDRFMTRVVDRIRELEPTQLVDVGCGEGFLAERVAHLPGVEAYRGIEINPDALALARSRLPELDFREGNILEEAEDKWADAAVCLEVLEHLDDPRTAVRNIARWTRSAAVISVPWEPYFRTGNLLRGKYLPTLGNHPEHVQQFRPASFQRLLRTGFEVVEIDTCFPWIIGICARPRF
jgi:SAM-dependent methyltransferase